MPTKTNEDTMRAYLREIGRVKLLEPQEEIELGRKVQKLQAHIELKEELCCQDWDSYAAIQGVPIQEMMREIRRGEHAKKRMVEANLRLVVSIAKKYNNRGMDLLDIIQEGTLGLVRGVEKFDPGRGYKFSTYAYWWIRQGITRSIQDKARSIRLPNHVQDMLNKDKKAQRELSQMLGRTPSTKEVAQRLEISEEELKNLRLKSQMPTSLQVQVGENKDSPLIDRLEDENLTPQETLEQEMICDEMRVLVWELPELQREVIRMLYAIGDDITEPISMTGVGKKMNMSRDRIRTLKNKAMNRLREMYSYNSNYNG